MNWEKVTKDGTTKRMRVPFGWIVLLWMSKGIEYMHAGSVSCSITSCFVFDPCHWWKVKKEKNE